MKVLLDSNVIISAFATRGLCFEIFALCLFEHEVITSQFIMEEVIKSLEEDFGMPEDVTKNHRDILLKGTKVVVPLEVSPGACHDPGDLKVLGTAWAGKADVIITGDKHLLKLKDFKSIAILTPREFWKRAARK